jgi:hypothetical protein
VHVGQRLATDGGLASNGRRSAEPYRTEVDPATWRLVKMEVDNTREDGTPDVMEIQTLEPAALLEAEHARAGSVVAVPLDLEEMGVPGHEARVVSVSACPPVQGGAGRVVLTTINHLNGFVFDLTLRDSSGQGSTLGVTGWHKFYTEDRGWVSASELRRGEAVRGREGVVTVASLARRPGVQRVYNFTVEADHDYYVGGLAALVHNAGCSELPNLTGKTRAEAEQLLKEKGFEYKGPTQGGYQKWYHPDGSRVQIRPNGECARTGPKIPGRGGKMYSPRYGPDGNPLPPGASHNTGEIIVD